MKSYILVNPHIEGTMDTKFKANSVQDAANMAYETLSSYFSNNLPKFSFTLQKGGKDNDKFYHFDVNEKINKAEKVKYTITLNEKANETILKKFIEENNEKQTGGKHRKYKKSYKYDDDSDSSEDSDDDYYYYYKPIVRPQPINYWSYSPYVYGYKKMYVPTFIPTVTPYINIYWETY